MSYLRRLDQARSHLGEGNLLAAERELREATAEWRASRLRAPLVEKGLEPALRTLGRIFGRRSEEPVLPVFRRRAELLREDLYAFARALATEVIEDISRNDLGPRARHEQAAEALTLLRSSEFFELPPSREWEIVKVWLQDGRQLGAGVRAELLPTGPAPAGDVDWWLHWLEGWCAAPAEPVRAFADWSRRLAVAYQRQDPEHPARWAWVEARLAMLDPLAAPFARPAVERVISGGVEDGLVGPALLSWAELVTNLRYLAGPGGNARDLFELRSMEAARAGIEWPPPGIVARLSERRPHGRAPVLVAVHWQDDAAAVCFVLHDGRSAIDVLCLKPAAEPDPADPFAMDQISAQRRIAAWIPPDAILLSAREPGPGLRGLVGSSRWVPVESLLELFGCVDVDRAPSTPGTEHPAWTREICGPWDALIPAARRLVPALEGLFTAWPSLVTLWGRDNLRRLGSRGVSLAEALADAAELVGSAGPVASILETAAPLQLVWPSLEARPWPAGAVGTAAAPPMPSVGPGRVWVDRRASADELAAVAMQEGASNLLCVGEERVLELAAAAARHGDASRVAVLGPDTPCAGALLDLLNRWVSESPGDLDRGRAAVWLLALLGETAGPMGPLLARSGDTDLVAEVTEHLRECDGGCGSHLDAPCWPGQAAARVHSSRVVVVDLERVDVVAPDGRRTVADDLRTWVVQVSDEEALRRLRNLPSGPEPVTVFTPGVAFLPALLGMMPSVDGADGGWTFEPHGERGDLEPSVWAAPPGYGARSVLLARESRSLVEERARRWMADVGPAALWGEDLSDQPSTLHGVAPEPTAETVLVPALGERDLTSPLLIGLRLAAAASHARRRVVCLSPTLAEVLELPGGLAYGEDESALPRALDSGAALLGSRRGRAATTWVSPLTRPRLESVGIHNARELASALLRWTPARGRVLAGVREGDRDALVDVLCRLQAEALDGGPLGVRAVVKVVSRAADLDESLPPAVRLRAIDRGRKLLVRIAADELGAEVVEDWARRNPAVAWVFRNAEALLDPARHEAAARLLAALRRSQARTVFLCDHVAEARRVREMAAMHVSLDPVAVIDEYPEGLDPADWNTRTLGALDAACPQCARPVSYAAAFTLCPDCGVPVDSVASVRRALRLGFEGRVVDALRQLGPQAEWTMIVFDAARRSRLRQRIGLDGLEAADAPLLLGAGRVSAAEVIVPGDLWRTEPVLGPVIVCGLPDSIATWNLVAGRLRARGLAAGEWWLAPPGLDETEPLPAAETEFAIARERFLEELGEGGDRVSATATLRRLEAAGGSFDASSALRVHELGRTARSDDAPLAALARAQRRGWVRAGSVEGLGRMVPAAIERAVRTGQRLRRDGAAPAEAVEPTPGRLIGVAGCGKTTALIEMASAARARHESVLVLVPHAVGRLEWIERLGDPGACCLHFDEFLLDFVGEVSGVEGLAEGLRVLPSADRRHGEEVRLDLVRSVSRLYEQECGELPAVDSRTLIRALEGERIGVDPVAPESNLDLGLLLRCVERARELGGWTDSRQLLERAWSAAEAAPRRARIWAGRFDAVFVDDAHDLGDRGLGFVRDLFGPRLQGVAIDPVLGLVPESDIDSAAMHSWRFGPAIAEAIEQVWRATTPLPAPVRGRGPGRSSVESERILALSAAIDRIADELGDVDDEDVAIVAAHERDRRLMEQQLGLRGIRVDANDPDVTELVTGPREVLAALAWISGHADPASAAALAVVLGAGPETSERDHAEHYEGRLRRRLAGEDVEVLDRVEAFLLPLVMIRSALGPSTGVDRAVDVLLGCGLLQRLQGQPAIGRRISNFVRQHHGSTVSELLDTMGLERILHPGGGGGRVRILAPDQLAGRAFDRIYYVCTGFEPPERHYRVLSRARLAVRIACSEVDPLQG